MPASARAATGAAAYRRRWARRGPTTPSRTAAESAERSVVYITSSRVSPSPVRSASAAPIATGEVSARQRAAHVEHSRNREQERPALRAARAVGDVVRGEPIARAIGGVRVAGVGPREERQDGVRGVPGELLEAHGQIGLALQHPERAQRLEPERVGEPAGGERRVGELPQQGDTVFESAGLRPVMKNVFGILWCSEPDSTSVKTDEFLKVGGANLRAGEGWQRLVALPVCTSCHARLDYSMQFSQGFLDVRVGAHYEAAKQRTGTMNFYARNIDDFRGKDVATPMGFARLSMSQPEFGECFAHKINRHIYGPNIELDDEAALLEGFDPQRTTFRGMMRTALLRYARKRLSGAPATANAIGAKAVDAVIAPSDGTAIPLSHPAVALISDHCMDCHDGPDGESGFDLREYLSRQMIPPETFNKILDRVSARQMPPMGSTLELRQRWALLTELVALEFRNDPAKRARALRHVVGQDRASSTYPFEAAITSIEDAAGVQLGRTSRRRANTGLAASAKRFIEGDVSLENLQFSPDFSAATGLLALDACKAAGFRDAALDECLARATDPALYIRPAPYSSSMLPAP